MTANNPHEITMRMETENRRLQALNAELVTALKVADKIMDVMWPVFEPHRPDHGGSPAEWIIEGFSQIETVLKKVQSQ